MPESNHETSNSNCLGITVSIITILLSIPFILSSYYLSNYQPIASCVKSLQWPIILVALSVLATGLLGLIASILRSKWVLVLYLVLMLGVIAAIAVLVGFVYVNTSVRNSSHGFDPDELIDDDSNMGSSGLTSLDEFESGWFRRRVDGSRYEWDKVRDCVASKAEACGGLNQKYRIVQNFVNAQLSPLQMGCCKPPEECGYTLINPTYYVNPTNTAGGLDCLLWSNNQTQLCYQCSNCKAGVLAELRKEWRKVDFVLFVTLAGLVSTFLVGCCFAVRRARMSDHDVPGKSSGYSSRRDNGDRHHHRKRISSRSNTRS